LAGSQWKEEVGCGKGKNGSTPDFGADNGYPEGVGPGAGRWGGATGESGESRAVGFERKQPGGPPQFSTAANQYEELSVHGGLIT